MPQIDNTTTKIFFGLINMNDRHRNTAYSIVIMLALGFSVNRLWCVNEESHKREYDNLMKLYNSKIEENKDLKLELKQVYQEKEELYLSKFGNYDGIINLNKKIIELKELKK
jgi:hypothetical protein